MPGTLKDTVEDHELKVYFVKYQSNEAWGEKQIHEEIQFPGRKYSQFNILPGEKTIDEETYRRI